MRVFLEGGGELQLEEKPHGQGSMGTGYLTRDGAHFVKLYHRETPQLKRTLHYVTERYNCTRDLGDSQREAYWNSLFLWPKSVVLRPRLGVVMDVLPREAIKLTLLCSSREYARLPADAKLWNLRVMMAWRLAQAVDRLHKTGVAHSDLSGNNIYVIPQRAGIRIIDIDGLVVPNIAPPTVLGTSFYRAPEVVEGGGQVGKLTDRHALAVVIYQLLLFGHPLIGPYDFGLGDADDICTRQLGTRGLYVQHPSDLRNRPKRGLFPAKMLGGRMESLFQRAFVRGLGDVTERPLADEWIVPIARILDRLIACQNPDCHERYFPIEVGAEVQCPWCHKVWRPRGGLPVLQMYQPAREAGGAIPEEDFLLACYPGRSLHVWHSDSTRYPGPFEVQDAIGVVERSDGHFRLRNEGQEPFYVLGPDGSATMEAPPGGHLLLQEGMRLRLGAEKTTSWLAVARWLGDAVPPDQYV